MTEKLTGAALLAELEQNPKLADTALAMRTGYTKQSRSRSGEARVKPDLLGYYKAVLQANNDYFGLVLPETQRVSSRGDTDSFKIQKNGAGIVPRRFMEMLGCEPGNYFAIKEGEDGTTLLIEKDVERSEAARLEAVENPAIAANSEADEDEEEDEEEEDAEEVIVQQPAIPGVDSTTVRIPQSVS